MYFNAFSVFSVFLEENEQKVARILHSLRSIRSFGNMVKSCIQLFNRNLQFHERVIFPLLDVFGTKFLEQNFCNKKTALCCIQIYGVENIHLLLNSESEVYLWRLAFLRQNSTLFEASSDSVVGFVRSKKEKLTSPKCFFKRRKNSCINTIFVTCISRNGNELSRWSMRRDKDIFYLWMETSYLLN